MFLVVNADDFGLSEGTNRAIYDAHNSGIVTSTSLLANGNAFDLAVELAHSCPSLGVGVHLTLSETPLTEISKAWKKAGQTLILGNGPYVRALLTGRLPRAQIRHEFEAQIQRVVDAGIVPTHLDGHKHIHLLPAVITIVIELAKKFAVPFVRIPKSIHTSLSRPSRLPGLSVLQVLALLARPAAKRAGIQTVDRLLGFVESGHLDGRSLERLLRVPRPGLTELFCHPGRRTEDLESLAHEGLLWIRSYEFESETEGISNPELRDRIQESGWRLTNFGILAQKSR